MRPSIGERVATSVRGPHLAILEFLEGGPSTAHEIAAALGMPVGAVRPAIRDLRKACRVLVFGEVVATGRCYQRIRDGLHLVAISCGARRDIAPASSGVRAGGGDAA
ncbi:winged helix-turn-helix domain-containing protein [Xanthobacter versatilis]|uniref:winged helix-turn-helix domain-containing protein n=1 Tax=Xanthobacter autotrophicus (strain ATCC BAA-1158 / Py2) TaxID=78245 RepID=UPI00372D758A